MPITMTNRPQLTGIIILFIGVALLAFTFVNAFMFLTEPLSIITTSDLAGVFGEALAPLIQACIRLMYLGIMGWIGSMLTVRGIPLVTYRHIPVVAPATTTEAKPEIQLQRQTIEQPKMAHKTTPASSQKSAPPQAPQQAQQQRPPLQQQTTLSTPPSQAPQQPIPTPGPQQPQSQSAVPQEQRPEQGPERKQEEPKAILIPPENQREE